MTPDDKALYNRIKKRLKIRHKIIWEDEGDKVTMIVPDDGKTLRAFAESRFEIKQGN